jgi:hypothetical protein
MTEQGSITISLRGWQWFLLGVVLTLALVSGISACYQGRKISRLTGLPVQIKLPDDLTSYERIISVSFHKTAEGETIKDVTYFGADGKVHTQEYNDWGIFQGSITWELQGQ